MNETNVTYELIENSHGETIVLRLEENGSITSIPADSANSDYQAYLASLEEAAE